MINAPLCSVVLACMDVEAEYDDVGRTVCDEATAFVVATLSIATGQDNFILFVVWWVVAG